MGRDGDVALIRRLLIANRGEIAIRIARAARERGIVPLGVYSEADATALHRHAMDDDAYLGPAAPSESYLDADRIVAAARTLRADAVHPGYGFLSEQAAFAETVRAAGMRFVGPPPAALAAVGSKVAARRLAHELGIAVVPGYDGDDQRLELLRAEAERIGTPLLIKASAGGGGRGMRLVEELGAFAEALAAARREALVAFGDEAVLLERYVATPRHVEVQILADAHGAALHLGERECSVQRRHQKIVEEAPSPVVDAATRAELGAAALRFARAVGYENAGTVEFLRDEAGRFYFLEMNARLQVEHAVTELVYGVDLVGLQLDVAGGAPLALAQDDLVPRGWALEARVYAEDPAHDYLPSTGTLTDFAIPYAPGIRVDAGVERGSEISVYYDALLAKAIAWAPDRHAAIARLTAALDESRIAGVQTNVALLLAVLRTPAFAAGDLSTGFIAEHRLLEHLAVADDVPDEAVLDAAALVLRSGRVWRIADVDVPLALDVEARRVRLHATRDDSAWRLEGDLAATLEPDRRVEGALDETGGTVTRDHRTYRFAFAPPPRAGESTAAAAAHADSIAAPMPGKIARVAVRPGDHVEPRALLVVLEAMKMEHRIEAPAAGVVSEVLVEPGRLVAGGTPLVRLDAAAS